jgi:hypothetical protein
MEFQSVIYGSIVFLALIFGDLGVTGVAALSGPLAALILEIEVIRKRREKGGILSLDPSQETHLIPAPKFEHAHIHYSEAIDLSKGSEPLACG